MLKRLTYWSVVKVVRQPPSGGCVLKLNGDKTTWVIAGAAAFGRLCVETSTDKAPTGRRPAAAFGRLCVETSRERCTSAPRTCSRLRAAVC